MRRSRRCARLSVAPHVRCVLAATLAASALACGEVGPATWSPADSAAVRALETAYVSAWRRNDRDGVLATLAPDAVLLPGGLEPIQGSPAIQEFWWPPEGPTTTITAYETTVEELRGSGAIAYVRGRGELSFEWEDAAGGGGARASRSVYLMVARRGEDGVWRIANRMWYTLPE